NLAQRPDHVDQLEQWMRSYRPEELFTADGALIEELAALPPRGARRMSANPHANGGRDPRGLYLPDYRQYGVDVAQPGTGTSEPTRVLGAWLRDVMAHNTTNFRLFGPDETVSNRLGAVLDASERTWDAIIHPDDD